MPTEQKGEPTLPGSKIPILKVVVVRFYRVFVVRIVDVGYSFFEMRVCSLRSPRVADFRLE